MLKSPFFIGTICSLAFIFGCNNSGTEKTLTTKSDTTVNTSEQSKPASITSEINAMKNLASDTSVVISHQEYPLLDDSWKSAAATTKSVVVDFGPTIGAKAELSVTFLKLDTYNSMIKSCVVKVLKRNPNYLLSATISEQFNQGTNTIYSFIYTDVYVTRKQQKHDGRDMIGKHFIIDSKPQTISQTE